MNNKAHHIYTTKHEDGFLAVSATTPRFALWAETHEGAVAKAQRALEYFASVKGERDFPAQTSFVTTPVYDRELLCA